MYLYKTSKQIKFCINSNIIKLISIIKIIYHVNVNMELDKNVNLGIGQFVPILFSLIDIIKLSFLKIDRS